MLLSPAVRDAYRRSPCTTQLQVPRGLRFAPRSPPLDPPTPTRTLTPSQTQTQSCPEEASSIADLVARTRSPTRFPGATESTPFRPSGRRSIQRGSAVKTSTLSSLPAPHSDVRCRCHPAIRKEKGEYHRPSSREHRRRTLRRLSKSLRPLPDPPRCPRRNAKPFERSPTSKLSQICRASRGTCGTISDRGRPRAPMTRFGRWSETRMRRRGSIRAQSRRSTPAPTTSCLLPLLLLPVRLKTWKRRLGPHRRPCLLRKFARSSHSRSPR